MIGITREVLASYLDDALSDRQTADIELELRRSEPLRLQLRQMMQDRERGEHTMGAIWRRFRLSCPERERLGSFLLGVLADEEQDYIQFHLKTIGCAFCLANLSDLEQQQKALAPKVTERRRRYFESSAGLLRSQPASKHPGK